MRLVRRVLGFALVAAGVVYLRARRKALRTAHGADVRFDDTVGTSVAPPEHLVDRATRPRLI